MSKYTTEVRYICENLAGLTESKGYQNIDEIISKSAPLIFNFTFPIFDESYRLGLESKILMHFYTREICEETYGLWKLRLRSKLTEIMPYYNQLYKSALLEFNPLYDVDITRDFNRNNNGENNATDTVSSTLTGTHTRTGSQVIDTDRTNKKTSETTNKTTNEGETTTKRNTSNTVDTDTSDVTEGTTKNVVDTDTTDSLTKNNTTTRDLTNDKTTNGTTNDDRWELYSDTPQGGLNGIGAITDPNPAQGDLGYLSNAKHIIDKTTNTGTDKIIETGTDVTNGTDTGKGTIDTTETETVNTTITGKVDTTETGTDNTTVNDSNTINVTGNVTDNGTGTEDTTVTDNFTNADNVTNEISNIGKSTISNTEQYIEHVIGKQGSNSYSKLIMEFRETFLNVDKMILDELEPLFFGLWM